jgi:hypothetical protein
MVPKALLVPIPETSPLAPLLTNPTAPRSEPDPLDSLGSLLVLWALILPHKSGLQPLDKYAYKKPRPLAWAGMAPHLRCCLVGG